MTGKNRLFQIVKNALAAVGLLFVLVTVTPLDAWILHGLCPQWNDPHGEVLIVLGADSLPDMIGLSTYWRCVYAVRVWRQGGFQRIVVSGGGPPGGAAIADQMRNFVVSQGVPADRIMVERESRDTHENALFTTKLLVGTPGRKVLLTSDFHTFRASRAFRKAGLNVQTRPIPDVAKLVDRWLYRWNLFVDLTTETVKAAYYFARGWI